MLLETVFNVLSVSLYFGLAGFLIKGGSLVCLFDKSFIPALCGIFIIPKVFVGLVLICMSRGVGQSE